MDGYCGRGRVGELISWCGRGRLSGRRVGFMYAPVLIALIAPAAFGAEYGTPVSIRQFTAMCAEPESGSQPGPPKSACEAYVVAFLESAGLLEHATRSPPRYCLPVQVSPRDLANAVIEVGKEIPRDDYPVAMVLRSLLETRFPCPAKP